MDDDLDRAQQLRMDGCRCQPREGAECLETSHDVGGGVGMQGSTSTLVPGVERGEHLTHLGTTDLTHDEAIGAHPQGLTHQRGQSDLATTARGIPW